MMASCDSSGLSDGDRLALRLFGQHDWMNSTYLFDLDKGESLDANRLDNFVPFLDGESRRRVARQAAMAMFDIFKAGYAHRDLHGKNLHWKEGQLKVTGFRHLQKYPESARPAFLKSFDICGNGLPPPEQGGMWYSKEHPLVLGHLLKVPLHDLQSELLADLKQRLAHASYSFRARNRRIKTSRRRIYASFRLPEFEVSVAEAQRNSFRRLCRFGINTSTIAGKRILDLGANVGSTIFSLQQFSPSSCLGIEYDGEKVSVANDIAAYCGLNHTRFQAGDIDVLKAEEIGQHDIVFCLAVDAHVHDKEHLYSLLAQITDKELYFEGNPKTDPKVVQAALIANGFSKVELLGVCDDDSLNRNNVRPLLVAKKCG